MDNNDIIDTLNLLIETSRDGDKGFTDCAHASKDASLKAYFTICAARCRESVTALTSEVTRRGGSAETSGTVMAGAHRAWLDLKTALTSDNDLAVLEECERAEDVAKSAYITALRAELPTELRTLVQHQFDGVRENHDRVKKLRDDKKLVAA